MSTPIRIGSEFLVNTTTANDQYDPGVAGLSNGGFVVTWQDESASGGDTSDAAVRGQVFASDGSKSGVEFLVNTTTASGQTGPSVAALSAGAFVVIWEDGSATGGDTSASALRGQVFAADGSKSGSEFLVNTTTANSQTRPSVATLSNGGFVVTWQDESATGDDTSGAAVRGQVFAADGSKSGSEFLVNTTTANSQTRPSVATLSNGGFVVTWQDESATGDDTSDAALRGQVFAADGSKSGSEFLVNTATANGQTRPRVAALSTGGFVVTWEDYSATGDDTAGAAVRGQVFAADGSKSGGEFLVNTTVANDQFEPSVTALGNGSFVVTWEDYSATGGDTSNSALRGQVFAANGSKDGDEFLINTTTADGQFEPIVVTLGNGGFVVTWEDWSATGGDTSGGAVRGQVFHSTGLSIAAADASKAEGSGGSTSFTFTVTRSGDTTGSSSVDYTVSGAVGNAASASDFQGGIFPTGTVSFAAGETSKPITVTVAGDTAVEADEGFTVTLSNSANAGIVTAAANGTILNDDQPPATNTGGGEDGSRDQTIMVPASGTVDAMLTVLSERISDPAERASLAALIASYAPPAATTIAVRTVTPTAGSGTSGAPIVISGGGSGQEALVVDARQLPADAVLRLDNVGYAVVLGNAVVHTGDSPQSLAMDGGRQSVVLGAGSDTLHGGGGDDVVSAGRGDDRLYGNAGADLLYSGKGDDELHGGKGDDVLYGDLGTDMVFGELGADSLQGGAGDDLVNGGLDNDTVHGGQDNDTVRGGKGDDQVFGDLGDDALWGDLGDDTLSGGAGADTFWIRTGDGHDVITDFNAAEGDRIGLADGLGYTTRTNAAGDAVIVFSDGSDLTLQGVGLRASGAIPVSWFVGA